MKKKHVILIAALVALIAVGAGIEFTGGFNLNRFQSKTEETKKDTSKDEEEEKEVVKPYNKPQEAKEAQLAADADILYSYGLYYDYANLTLEETVKAFLDENGIDHSNVTFSYKNTETNEVIEYNQTQAMTAGSTYKLPLNMVVVDEVEKGKLSYDERYPIDGLEYENYSEYTAYLSQFGDSMNIHEMQEYSIVYSENTPAYALMSLLGGPDKAYTYFDRYGVSESKELPTIDNGNGNITTSSYFIKVLDHLWKNQEKYKDIIYYLDEAFSGQWFEMYLTNVRTLQKPGYSREALNWDGVVYEETPYLLSLYTRYFGNANESSVEIDNYGYTLVAQLGYVINEWHRVNQNPAESSSDSEDVVEEEDEEDSSEDNSSSTKSSTKKSSSTKSSSKKSSSSTDDEEDEDETDYYDYDYDYDYYE